MRVWADSSPYEDALQEIYYLKAKLDFTRHQLIKEIKIKETALRRSQCVYLRQRTQIADLKKRLLERI